jgi:hypothetical protein
MNLLLHPVEVPDWLNHRLPQSGVHVMDRVDGPAVPLWTWIEARLVSPRQPGKESLRQAVDSFRREFPA